MSTALASSPDQHSVQRVVDAACSRIAPAWPLDRMIAVNPYWGWTSQPVREAAAALGALSGAPFLMPRRWYQRRQADGAIPSAAIERAIQRNGFRGSQADVEAALHAEAEPLPRHPSVSDIRDALRDARREFTWEEHLTRQIGLSCATYFDEQQAGWQPSRDAGLYAFWRSLAESDLTPRLLLGDGEVRAAIAGLPENRDAVIAEAIATFALPRAAQEAYLSSLLMRVGGWASYAAFRAWEARLRGATDDSLQDLLAIRVAWDLVLYRSASGTDVPTRWTRARRDWGAAAERVPASREADWVLQRAFELRYQDKLGAALVWHPSLRHADTGSRAPGTVAAQAVFCIDVRSEVFRRHLEDSSPDVRTLGFAGFFGLPIAYESLGGTQRPQLPGLLGASMLARDDEPDRAQAQRAATAAREAAAQWSAAARTMPGAFSIVETTGIAAALRLAMATFEPTRAVGDPLRFGRDNPALGVAPQLLQPNGQPLADETRVALALGILRGMSLVKGFAPLVALVGHGAVVTNNPQAAGLACGACGGQSGEVNARAAAALLNDPLLRQGLAEHGVTVPLTTRFVAGLHDTTSDDVLLFPDAQTAATHADELAELTAAFARASRRVRLERASRLGDLPSEPQALADALRQRAADWSELRPEWALARNAAFIAAPRSRSRALDLKGRAFLHEYDCHLDPSGAVLEGILTAPMIVAHWINFQYWASTVDPQHFGSGDKTRHNVVGGALGVVEGAGGDLRLGLAQQSVHDGTDFVHEPMRLAVYVEADAETIDAIIARQPTVKQLVEGEWLFLYRIDPNDAGAYLRGRDGWEAVAAGAASRW